jgi:hypothetical protein
MLAQRVAILLDGTPIVTNMFGEIHSGVAAATRAYGACRGQRAHISGNRPIRNDPVAWI